MRVVGLDLSLRSTGVADEHGTHTITCKMTGVERLVELRDLLLTECSSDGALGYNIASLVVIEGYNLGVTRRGDSAHNLGELGGVVRVALHENGILWVAVPPAVTKKYAAGKGNASKDQVLVAAAKRLPDFDGGNDEADAAWLRAMALDHYGEPIVEMPALNRSALLAVPWPELAVAA